MSLFDWVLVLVLNGPIIGYGFLRSRDTKTSADWFLAGRSLSWWVVGLSLYATAIDSSDLVADSGGTYVLGFSYFVTNWVGVVVGWVLAAHFIVLTMYRPGCTPTPSTWKPGLAEERRPDLLLPSGRLQRPRRMGAMTQVSRPIRMQESRRSQPST